VGDTCEEWIARQKRDVRLLANRLESGYRRGTLSSALADNPPAIEGIDRIISAYAKAAPMAQIRPTLFDALLGDFKQNLKPPVRWFPALDVVIATGQESDEAVVERLRYLRIEGPAGEVRVRVDQLFASRRWGIGFSIQNPEMDKLVAKVLVEWAVQQLATGLQDLFHIDRIWRPTRGTPAGFISTPQGAQFENLMLDILNEEQYVARRARLYEDFMEKTDLRVHVPKLQRKRGARVQVTQISRPTLHNRKLSTIHNVEELVILSPLSLAQEAVDSPAGAEPIKALLLLALESATAHPLGPVAEVPADLRRLVRKFVNAEAHRSTSELRRREEETRRIGENLAGGSACPTSLPDFEGNGGERAE
jgi:hypothetical protein